MAIRRHGTIPTILTHGRLGSFVEMARNFPLLADPGALANYFVTVQHGISILARVGASRATLVAVADHAMAAWDRLVE